MSDENPKPWPKCWFPECDRPAAGNGSDRPRPCWGHASSDEETYPVIVEYTYRHVVWVAAEDQQDAVRRMQDEPYEKTSDQETLVESGWSVQAPKDSFDWGDVMNGGYYHPYQGTEADAHVEEHRRYLANLEWEAKKAACVEAGHPGFETYSTGRRYCRNCGYLPELAEAVSDVH